MIIDENRNYPWSDESLPQTDISGRSAFAQVVASRINSCEDGQGSTVFGLVGPWGSGKTTMLQDIESRLAEWTVVSFNPWSASDPGSIASEFISSLAAAFPKRSVKRRIASYSRFGIPLLDLVPMVGRTLSALTLEISTRPPWHVEFERLSNEISKQHRRVLFIVDDVDRLDGEELRALLRVVRLLGRFTNVHYLLAYDQSTVESVLSQGTNGGSFSNFMEKIVQFPFEVPPAPMVDRRRWSRAVLDTVLDHEMADNAPHPSHYEDLVRILASGLETPRAAQRLKEQLRALSGLLPETEIDVLDFAALTWIRLAHHNIWDHIRLNEDAYLSWSDSDSNDVQTKRMDRIVELVKTGHTTPVCDIVRYLFDPPRMMGFMSNRRGRVQNPKYFHRYFHVSLTEDDLSELRTRRALDELATAAATSADISYLDSVLTGSDEDRSVLAAETAYKLRQASQNPSQIIVHFLADIRERVLRKTPPFFASQSAIDRWLSLEVFFALEAGTLSAERAIHLLGYDFLSSACYSLNRSRLLEPSRIQEVYIEVARVWLADIAKQNLSSIIQRPELIRMTSFCLWVKEIEDFGGFLECHIDGTESLIDAAAAYVSFNEWVGSGVSYEPVFRLDEFRFAISGANVKAFVSAIPELSSEAAYQVRDLPSANLSAPDLRDFATRSLLFLDLE